VLEAVADGDFKEVCSFGDLSDGDEKWDLAEH